MKKKISIIFGIAVIILGLAEIIVTLTGNTLPSPLHYLLGALCVINAMLILMNAKKKG